MIFVFCECVCVFIAVIIVTARFSLQLMDVKSSRTEKHFTTRIQVPLNGIMQKSDVNSANIGHFVNQIK